MALDHYLARTYLKHWCDQDAGRPIRAYRKSDGAEFPCWPANVCTEPNGDLNPKYLAEPNALGVFRKIWEPRWNEAVDALLTGKFDANHKFVIAAGWASISLTTPTTTGVFGAHDRATQRVPRRGAPLHTHAGKVLRKLEVPLITESSLGAWAKKQVAAVVPMPKGVTDEAVRRRARLKN